MVSARNPPPICVGIPYLKKGGSVCVQFYNLNVGKKSFSGCSRLLGRLLFVTIIKVNVGCFHVNFLNSTQQVHEMEVPYLDEPQALPEGPEPIYIGEVPFGYKKN